MLRTSSNTGMIVKVSGGFYTVELAGGLIECRARGIFRKDNFQPCVGDTAVVSRNEDGSGCVDEILERKNVLVRPPLANLDAMVVVVSIQDPAPNLFVTDKFIAVLEHKRIEPVIAITKSDLQDACGLAAIYENAGFSAHVISSETGEGVDGLRESLKGRFSAFSGNSGVGKSSLLNAIDARLGLEVGQTSKKLGRGRHTTRTVEIFTLENGGRVADTPGFSTVDLLQMSEIDKYELPQCFREFAPHVKNCRFDDCTHTSEPGCGVLLAVQNGEISQKRHTSYLQMFDQLKDVKEWERRTY